VAACRERPGNRGVVVLRRDADERSEMRFLSLWANRDAIRAFGRSLRPSCRTLLQPADAPSSDTAEVRSDSAKLRALRALRALRVTICNSPPPTPSA
jgi:hypothetical protein